MCPQRTRRRQGQELGDQMHFAEQDWGSSKLDNQNELKSDHGLSWFFRGGSLGLLSPSRYDVGRFRELEIEVSPWAS